LQKDKVTIKNIAQRLGLTPATISKALRDSSDISEKTKIRVRQLAEEMGYQPNLMARSLVSKKSNILGVIVPNLTISFFSEVVRGIYEHARSRGYETIILVNDEKYENESKNLDFLYALHVDGILINAVPGGDNNHRLINMMRHGIQVVAYDRGVDGMNLSAVAIDDEKAAYQVVRTFVSRQRRRIMFFGPTTTPSVARGRYRGYRKALADLGIHYDPALVVPCEIDDDHAYFNMKTALKEGIRPDAVMCTGGLVAYGGGKAILECGLNIPDDVLLAEFGDNAIVHRLGVPFITVNQSPYEMGCKSVDLIVDQIGHPAQKQQARRIIIETRLLEYQKKPGETGIQGHFIG
jgi:DNA-binding LacI/PurR family transcriptional regulator